MRRLPRSTVLFRAGFVAMAITATLLSDVAAASRGKAREIESSPVTPTITITSPDNGGSYERQSRIYARFRCNENGSTTPIASCQATVARGHPIDTTSDGVKTFTVIATDTSGNTVTKTVRYTVWAYVNPLRAVANLQSNRIDMGVDYSGSGAILALGRARVVLATDRLAGPESCWGRTCVPPPGDMIVYRLLDGPFAGKDVYVVEHITIDVKAGETVGAGRRIAILHQGSPNLEIGWASGHGAQTLAVARDHQCACTDPGAWSSIEGRDFNSLLVWLGAPSGYLTKIPPHQRMPSGWPRVPSSD